MSKWKDKKIAVLCGGISAERQISLQTGNAMAKALKSLGYNVECIDADQSLPTALQIHKPDVAVIALHGKFGEDGCVQGMLEWMKIPYTGAGVMASAIAVDKLITKQLAAELGITVASSEVFYASKDDAESFCKQFNMSFPVMVKPSREGSTINMTKVNARSELLPALNAALESDDVVLFEQYISGTEVTVGVLNGELLPVVEIAPKQGFYDYAAKYTKGKSEYFVPARIDKKQAARLCSDTKKLAERIGCLSLSRADFIIADEKAYFLEINTVPGMVELSLIPQAAAAVGISFENLCERILESAALKN